MMCLRCSTLKGDIVEMEHREDEEAVHDPSANDGYGVRKVCWYECPFGHQEECDLSIHSPDDV